MSKQMNEAKMGRPLSCVAQRAFDLIAEAGSRGVSTAEVRAAFPQEQDSARKACMNAVRRGWLFNMRSRRLTVYYSLTVERRAAEEQFATRVAERDAHQAALARARESRRNAGLRAGVVNRATINAKVEAVRAQLRAAAEKARLEREQRAKREKEGRAARAEAARKRAATENSRVQRDTAMNNAMAQAARGRYAGIEQPAKPVPVVIDYSRAVVTIDPPKRRWHEALEVSGDFEGAGIGRYVAEPVSCAARAAA